MDANITRLPPSGPALARLASTPLTTSMEGIAQLLEEQQLIGRLPKRDLLELASRSYMRTLRAREQIYREGDAGRHVVAIVDGFVKLCCNTQDGQEIVLEIVGAGKSFGELSVLNDCPRETDAVAVSPCRVLSIDGRHFMQLMARNPEGTRIMVKLISDRLLAATQRVVDGSGLPAPARIARTLLHLADLQCVRPLGRVRVRLLLSQAELGGMAGLTRESVNKHLASLRDAGLITLEGGTVTSVNVVELRAVLTDTERQRTIRARDLDRGEFDPPPPARGVYAVMR
jgi:CRP/FNR family transcriptional regulator, cyclic AMP receptor protein